MSGLSVTVLTSAAAEAIISACTGTCFLSCCLRYLRFVLVCCAMIATERSSLCVSSWLADRDFQLYRARQFQALIAPERVAIIVQ